MYDTPSICMYPALKDKQSNPGSQSKRESLLRFQVCCRHVELVQSEGAGGDKTSSDQIFSSRRLKRPARPVFVSLISSLCILHISSFSSPLLFLRLLSFLLLVPPTSCRSPVRLCCGDNMEPPDKDGSTAAHE